MERGIHYLHPFLAACRREGSATLERVGCCSRTASRSRGRQHRLPPQPEPGARSLGPVWDGAQGLGSPHPGAAGSGAPRTIWADLPGTQMHSRLCGSQAARLCACVCVCACAVVCVCVAGVPSGVGLPRARERGAPLRGSWGGAGGGGHACAAPPHRGGLRLFVLKPEAVAAAGSPSRGPNTKCERPLLPGHERHLRPQPFGPSRRRLSPLPLSRPSCGRKLLCSIELGLSSGVPEATCLMGRLVRLPLS